MCKKITNFLHYLTLNKNTLIINPHDYYHSLMLLQKNIKKLRKEFGISQADLAQHLGLSRPTVVNIESGKRPMTRIEQQKLNEIFGFVNTKQEMKNSNVRIDIPQKNIEKFKQVFLYVTQKVGGRPNAGMTVLYKLLYFIDFDYYEKYEQQLMGLTYFKNTYGPAPREFIKVVEAMKKDEEISEIKNKHFSHEQTKFLPIIEPDLSVLTGRELEMIDSVIARYGDKTANELSELSHIDTPWACAEMGENLKYEHVFYRPDQFSVREYDTL